MAVLVWGTGAALAGRPAATWVWLSIGALNRETALVLAAVTALVGLDTPRRRHYLAWAGLMLVSYLLVRQMVVWVWPDNPGPPLHFTVEGRYRVLNNLEWLAEPEHAITFVASLSFVPLAWWMSWSFIPVTLRRLHGLVLLMLGALLVLANAYEPRAFGEVVVLSWMAIGVGLGRWLDGAGRCDDTRLPWLRWFDRASGLVVVLGFVCFVGLLHAYRFLPVAQWPMPR
jgi:hypothetical protein